jgi:hypothetical protein
VNVKQIVKAVQTWTEEEWALAAQLRKLGGQTTAPKAKRKYTRKAKATEPAPKAKKEARSGNGGDGLAFPKPGAKRGRGRPRKVHSMIPAPVVEAPAEA